MASLRLKASVALLTMLFERAFAEIGNWANQNGGEVVGVFENEPENMNALVELFPSAVSVFVKGAFLKPEPVREEALQIRDFWF